MSISSQQYINITKNIISGYNNSYQASINVSASPTNTVIGLNYSTTNLGFEILPNPGDGGIIRYRYSPASTTTVLGFDGPNMLLNVANLTTNAEAIINPSTNTAVINMLSDRISEGGIIGINAKSGLTRIFAGIDSNQQGQIKFYADDVGNPGTMINTSTVASKYIVGSTIELATGVILHPPNDLSISSILNMDINGNLYWNGTQINSGVQPSPPSTYSSFLSSFDYVYTSSLQTTNIIIRGSNTLSTAVLSADSNLTLYWNNVPLNSGSNTLASTIFEFAQISNVSTLKITASSIQGVYDTPSLPAKWLIAGKNNGYVSPIYNSLNNQATYNLPQSNGTFSNSGNCIYGNMYTGQIIAVGTDITNSFNTIQWSSDAQNWTNIYTNNPFSNSAKSVYYANNLWLIGGISTQPNKPPILWSTDGYNFNSAEIFPSDAGTTANSFSFNGNLYVAGLNKGYDYSTSIMWSIDGRKWNRINSGGFNTTNAVASNNNIWVACGIPSLPGALNRIQWSSDAINWNSSQTIPISFNTGNAIHYANGIWVLGGSGTNNQTTLLWSTDGINWNAQNSGTISNVYDVKYIQDTWYAAGNIDGNGALGILTSKDGMNWSYPSTYASQFYQLAVTNIYYLETVLLGNGSLNLGPSTSMYVTATVSSYTLNTTKIIGQMGNITNASISTLNASYIVSPNYVQEQMVTF